MNGLNNKKADFALDFLIKINNIEYFWIINTFSI